jgi:hypothetical protein
MKMKIGTRYEAGDLTHEDAINEMVAYGITMVPIEYFHYKGFRYTNLLDAIAQAKRDLSREHGSDGRS